MGESSARPDPGAPDGSGAGDTTPAASGRAPVTRPGLTDLTSPPPPQGAPPAAPRALLRQGPGVPVAPEPRAGLTAEDIWRAALMAARGAILGG